MIYNQFIHYIVDHLLLKRVLVYFAYKWKTCTFEFIVFATHQCKKGNNLNAPFRKNNILQLTKRFITFDDLIKNLACN